MTPDRASRSFGISTLLGSVALFAGLAILLFEFMAGDGLSIIGAGIALVGGSVLFLSKKDGEGSTGPEDAP